MQGICLLRPRKIKDVHQKKVAAKEQLLAVHNCIQHVGFSFDQIWPEEGLRPIDPLIETRLSHEFEGETRTYVHNAITKECHWEPLNGEHYRLVLAPDEGSSLFTGFMFLASKGAAIGFNRDERYSVCRKFFPAYRFCVSGLLAA